MPDQGEGGRAPLRDEAELFRDFNRQFVRTLQSRTNAPREIVDDACGFTWRLRQIEASHLSLSFHDGGDADDVGCAGPPRPGGDPDAAARGVGRER